MNTALPQKELEALLDDAVQEVTAKISGVRLSRGGGPPGGDPCTVYITFRREFRSSLSLQADAAMLCRMARHAMEQEEVSPQDLEDFAKEYFNVLCGKIAAIFFKTTKKPARFSVPSFYWGLYEPEGRQRQFALSYSDGQDRSAQLIHYIPRPDREDRAASGTISA